MLRRTLGAIALVAGACLLVAGVLGVVTFGTSGTLEATSTPLKSDQKSYALVADIVGINTGFPGSSSLGKTTLGALSNGGERLFVGVGPRYAVDKYLLGVPFDAVRQDSSAWQTKVVPGAESPAPPMNQKFWMRQGTGNKPTVEFTTPPSGSATYVIMNADGSPAVAAQMTIGFTSPMAFPVSLGAIVLGGLAVALGLFLLLRRRRPTATDSRSDGDADVDQTTVDVTTATEEAESVTPGGDTSGR